ncbi:hypothetical protein KsCSTR_42680 [Candidatus Kuenenia stuttgartiensis]|uniref:Uncharacterized protein n=1 Tax=Kuenenia stuttgartiensis TaxID=174633 RepID=Q1PXB5_KUEST|nr:hypothetical protein KsCSTR_42680 [Candidatus Kuenenia stuttgartiensis]CAJ71872.1 unknown protein [Candidatus Kuenenia stuttgartiensis]
MVPTQYDICIPIPYVLNSFSSLTPFSRIGYFSNLKPYMIQRSFVFINKLVF